MTIQNTPLTVEYLRKINAEPLKHWVWIEILDPERYKHFDAFSGYYRVSSDYTDGESLCCGYPGVGYSWAYADYGVSWIAYKTDPRVLTNFSFDVVFAETGEPVDFSDYPTRGWDWAEHLIYCDIGNFALEEDGTLILTDDCGNLAYPPDGLFNVTFKI